MEKQRFFAYSWHVDKDEEEVTAIRVYGLNEKNENVCVRINDFMPYVYIELPDRIPWDRGKAQLVGNKIDEIMGRQKPLKKELMLRKKLYGAHLDKHGNYKQFPYLFCAFSNRNDIKTMTFRMKKQFNVVGIGSIKVKIHETDADEILQLICCQNLPTAGWIDFVGKRQSEAVKLTLCHHEFIVKWNMLTPHKNDLVASPKIMGFDIEVNSTIPTAMPQASRPGDKIFQISCVLCRHGENQENYEKHLLTLGQPDLDIVGDDVLVTMFDTEAALLEGFTEFIREENPNVIVGYNILGFDIPYMIERAKLTMTIFNFDKQGFHKYAHAKEKTIKWSSSAYKNQEFQFLDAEGRIYVDLLPLVKRDFKFNNYKLKTIAEHFVSQTKDPLSPQGIFKCYRLGMKRNEKNEYGNVAQKAMGIVAKYCIQDSVLVLLLFDKLQTWVGLTEMAKTCNVSIFSLYTQGQQIKVYSQMYKYCFDNFIVVEKDAYQVADDERYVGAHVFPPKPGRYNNVVPFDFCLSGDTLISLSNGLSIRIEQLSDPQNVLTYNNGIISIEKFVNGLQNKGIRNTVKIYMQSGETITCTPEHKFMLEDGTWCEAQYLSGKKVKRGICYVEDIQCEDELLWKYQFGSFLIDTIENRANSLAFARILGYIYADGSIYVSLSKNKYIRKCCEACFGTILDAETFANDLKLLGLENINIRKRQASIKGITYSITLPNVISTAIHSIEGIIVGKRSTQPMKLPKFILDDNCPKAIIREFLAGIFGGDGSAPSLNSRQNTFSSVTLKWTTIEKYVIDMRICMINIQKLLKKVGVESNILDSTLVKYGKNSIQPKDHIDNPRYDTQLIITQNNTVDFATKIGFRYCINKSCRLDIVKTYRLMEDNTRRQHRFVVSRTNELIENNILNTLSRKKGQKTFLECLSIAQQELINNEPIINTYSLSSVSDIGYQRGEDKRHYDKPRRLSLQSKKFIKPKEYIDSLGVSSWFSVKGYCVGQDEQLIPTYNQIVIDVRDNGKQPVYDIEVRNTHNFIANGVVSHNCSLYPTTIIAYNIDYHTWVPDDSDIPDSMCHVMTWEDHISCIHDPKIIRIAELTKYIDSEKETLKKMREKKNAIKNKILKKEMQDEIDKKVEELKPYTQERSDLNKTKSKNPMCAKRYYRFLKQPRGVLPTIIQNLLDARAHTRKVDMKNINSKIKEFEADSKNHSKEITELKNLLGVLDKRQLAYKVSANSVSSDTPIPCKINDKFVYKNIEDISQGDWKSINEDQEISTPLENLLVWSDKGYTKPKYIMRHPQEKPLKRIITHNALVDCTEDHSLLSPDGNQVKPSELSIGDSLMHHELPLPCDLPDNILYDTITTDITKNHPLLSYSEELAYCHGLFFAEGTSNVWGSLGKAKATWIIYNQDIELLEKACQILNKNEGEFTISKYEKSCVYYLRAKGNLKELCKKYRNEFYDSRGNKKIPDYIFNVEYSVRLAFFIGYYAGDGARKLKKGVVISNKGQIGTAGLIYLANSLGYKTSISNGKNNKIIRVQCCQNFRNKYTDKIKTIKNSPEINLAKPIHNVLIRNQEQISLRNGYYNYRNIKIYAERFPCQKLLDSLDQAIISVSNRNSYITEYYTSTKKIKYQKLCCGKEYSIALITIKLNLPQNYNCKCSTKNINDKNNIDIFEKKDYNYVYDIETENHHFAAGVGNMIVHNSMYGSMGVKRGYLPFMAGAMATTYMGRTNIERVAETICKKYGGELVYGDQSGPQQVAA